jgi:hypothetical protein
VRNFALGQGNAREAGQVAHALFRNVRHESQVYRGARRTGAEASARVMSFSCVALATRVQ